MASTYEIKLTFEMNSQITAFAVLSALQQQELRSWVEGVMETAPFILPFGFPVDSLRDRVNVGEVKATRGKQ